MCGRYALCGPQSRLREQFDLDYEFDFPPRYNIAPMTSALVVRETSNGREAAFFRWGLLPRWAKEPGLAARLNNARAENVASKPAFRSAFKRSRCLIPASGFYEWTAASEAGKPVKNPWYIHPTEGLFGFAGLTERWTSPEGDEVHTCCIITTTANELMTQIHNRMPVIIAPSVYEAWLDSANTNPEFLCAFLEPAPSEGIAAHRVGRRVNVSRNDGPDLIEPFDV